MLPAPQHPPLAAEPTLLRPAPRARGRVLLAVVLCAALLPPLAVHPAKADPDPLAAPDPTSRFIRDDNGVATGAVLVDDENDHVAKRLVLPPGSMDGGQSARLWVYAQGLDCTPGSFGSWLYIDDQPVSAIDCGAWSPTAPMWAPIDVPLTTLADGRTNTASIQQNEWSNDRATDNLVFGVSNWLTHDYQRSDVSIDRHCDPLSATGTASAFAQAYDCSLQTGLELMWYLELVGAPPLPPAPPRTLPCVLPGDNFECAFDLDHEDSWWNDVETTAGYSTQPGEPLSCGNMGPTEWARYTAPSGGSSSTFRVSTGAGVAVAIYHGKSWDFGPSQCGSGAGGSTLVETVSPGETIYVQIAGMDGASKPLLITGYWTP
jgi:hypothetical protein